ncbi:MAG: FHA domain-containing protein [Solirubrobacterales bacterium]|nr:FHA domain-containing protein [Solirubrobacterales bacterium]
MTVRCPRGHESETADYCDQCGAPIGGAGTAGPVSATADPAPGIAGPAGIAAGATQILPVIEEVDTTPAARREPCPACGAPRSGDDRYCEGCGHDFLAPPPAPTGWEAVVTADRAQFDRLAVAGVTFPVDYLERRFALSEGENRIGRSRGQPDEDPPEIDLAPPPVDPGISRLHAVLERRGDAICVLRDLGSTNGTALGDEPAPIAPHTDVPVSDGDRIRLGAWTTITVHLR